MSKERYCHECRYYVPGLYAQAYCELTQTVVDNYCRACFRFVDDKKIMPYD